MTDDGSLSRGEFLGTVATLASVVIACAVAWTQAVPGWAFGLVLAGMFATILAVRIIVP
jgi:hypothetical protein